MPLKYRNIILGVVMVSMISLVANAKDSSRQDVRLRWNKVEQIIFCHTGTVMNCGPIHTNLASAVKFIEKNKNRLRWMGDTCSPNLMLIVMSEKNKFRAKVCSADWTDKEWQVWAALAG